MGPLDHPAAALFEPQPAGRCFINAAYMSPKPRASLEAMRRTVERLASPDFSAEEFFEPGERVRELLARVVGGEASRYSLTGSASFGMATLAWNLRLRAEELVGSRRRIVGIDGQFPSNVHSWRRLEPWGFQLELVPGGAGVGERLLDAIDARTALVAVAPLSWTDGRRIELQRILGAAAERGALTLLDVTQSAGVDPPLAPDLPIDLVIGAGYKWVLGDYGTGYMRLTPELQEKLEPLEASWKNFEGAQDFNRLTDYPEAWAGPAARFDHGESSAFVRLGGWEAALRVLLELDEGEVGRHASAFARELRGALDLERFEMSDTEDEGQAAHLFRVAPRNPARFQEGSRALQAAGVSVSCRDGGWRLSPHVYNDARDVERFASALAEL